MFLATMMLKLYSTLVTEYKIGKLFLGLDLFLKPNEPFFSDYSVKNIIIICKHSNLAVPLVAVDSNGA